MFAKTIPSNQRQLSVVKAFLLAMVSVLLIAGISCGQDPEFTVDQVGADYIAPELTEDLDRTERTTIRRQISEVNKRIKDGRKNVIASLEGTLNARAVDKYIQEYVFPKMTMTDNETLSNLGSLRKDFLDDYVSADITGSNRQHMINNLIIPEMQKIAVGNYHPAVRLNAVLIVGQINSVDPTRTQLPRPSTECIQFLIRTMGDDSLPEYVKVAAMTGIHRNAMFDAQQTTSLIDGTQKGQIGTIAMSIATSKANGQDKWSPETSYWLRRRAVQTIGFLKEPGPAGDRVTALLDILSNEKEKFWLRFDAMMAMEDMAMTSDNADRATEEITRFMAKSLRQESAGLEEKLTELVAVNLLYGDKDLMEVGSKAKDDGIQRGASFDVGAGGGIDENADKNNSKPKIDLPTYQLNLVRRRIQALSSTAKTVLTKVGEKASADKKTIATDASNLLDGVVTDSDVGLVDLGADEEDDNALLDEEDEGPPKAIADQMAEIFVNAASRLEKLISKTPEASNPDAVFDN